MILAEIQRLFHALATGAPVPPASADLIAVSTPALPAAERIAIYAEMYLARLVDALRADFPKLAALLGDPAFFALGEAYARPHPSDHPDVGRFGRRLPAFLRQRPAPERPDLSALAELEWARRDVFFEAAAEPVGRAAVAALPREAFPSARLWLVPALRLVRLDHDVLPLWRALEDGAAPPPPAPGPAAAAVWRSGCEVFHSALPADEARALEAALGGEDLGRVCAAFAGRDEPAEAAFAALASWVDDGWVAGMRAAETGRG